MFEREPVIEILEPEMVEVYRRMTHADRLGQAFRLWQTARLIVRSAVEQQHPDWDEPQVLKEVARRMSNGATDSVPQ